MNAARKLAKLGGRDWDREKEETDWNPAHSRPPVVEERENGWDQIRDERRFENHRGRGRGRGRGNRGGNAGNGSPREAKKERKLDVKDKEAFPALTPAVESKV